MQLDALHDAAQELLLVQGRQGATVPEAAQVGDDGADLVQRRGQCRGRLPALACPVRLPSRLHLSELSVSLRLQGLRHEPVGRVDQL
ncbi:MAG: hypothetical protein ACRDI2_24115, partial [Chloroflexota bacterium]